MKNSRVKTWIKDTIKKNNITESELANTIGSIDTPEWISVQSHWEDGLMVGSIIYDDLLDQRWCPEEGGEKDEVIVYLDTPQEGAPKSLIDFILN